MGKQLSDIGWCGLVPFICGSFCLVLFVAILPLFFITFAFIEDANYSGPEAGNPISVSVSSSIDNNTLIPSLFVFDIRIELRPSIDTQYRNTTLFLIRRDDGSAIDEFPIPGARVRYQETRHVDVLLKLSSYHLFSDSDPVAKLQAQVRFCGEELGGGSEVAEEATCDVDVDLESRMLAYNDCKLKVSKGSTS